MPGRSSRLIERAREARSGRRAEGRKRGRFPPTRRISPGEAFPGSLPGHIERAGGWRSRTKRELPWLPVRCGRQGASPGVMSIPGGKVQGKEEEAGYTECSSTSGRPPYPKTWKG